ncbi:MAG: hypothetical protein U0Z75_08415 [Deinococcaceae bacterium]
MPPPFLVDALPPSLAVTSSMPFAVASPGAAPLPLDTDRERGKILLAELKKKNARMRTVATEGNGRPGVHPADVETIGSFGRSGRDGRMINPF